MASSFGGIEAALSQPFVEAGCALTAAHGAAICECAAGIGGGDGSGDGDDDDAQELRRAAGLFAKCIEEQEKRIRCISSSRKPASAGQLESFLRGLSGAIQASIQAAEMADPAASSAPLKRMLAEGAQAHSWMSLIPVWRGGGDAWAHRDYGAAAAADEAEEPLATSLTPQQVVEGARDAAEFFSDRALRQSKMRSGAAHERTVALVGAFEEYMFQLAEYVQAFHPHGPDGWNPGGADATDVLKMIDGSAMTKSSSKR